MKGRSLMATSSIGRPTFTNWVVFRALGGVPALKETKVYPLSAAADPHQSSSSTSLSAIQHRARQRLLVLRGGQHHRPRGADHFTRPRTGWTMAGIGIVHGQPFVPDDRRRSILDNAARTAAAISGPSCTLLEIPRPRSTKDLRGHRPFSAAATSSSIKALGCWMHEPRFITSPPSSPPPWRMPRSERVPPTLTRQRRQR